MKYKVTLIAYFDTAAPLNTVKDALLTVWSQAVNINVGMSNEERTQVKVEKCYHDQVPPLPCEKIFEKVKA